MNERDLGVERKAAKALRIAAVAAMVALILSSVLLIKETAYTFVVFMFLGPPLILLAAAALGWVIFQELKAKKVL
jgi:hypothetical protein